MFPGDVTLIFIQSCAAGSYPTTVRICKGHKTQTPQAQKGHKILRLTPESGVKVAILDLDRL